MGSGLVKDGIRARDPVSRPGGEGGRVTDRGVRFRARSRRGQGRSGRGQDGVRVRIRVGSVTAGGRLTVASGSAIFSRSSQSAGLESVGSSISSGGLTGGVMSSRRLPLFTTCRAQHGDRHQYVVHNTGMYNTSACCTHRLPEGRHVRYTSRTSC